MSAPTSGTADVPTADIHAPNPDLTLNERRCLVDQALILIDQVYVHLPFKRAMHAVDPVQRLKLLRGRLGVLSAREFHNELILIFNDLRDLHTRYILPGSYQGKSAYLPFLIEECYEGEEARYIVSKLMPGFCEANFQVGARVTHWNGVAIERVVALNADRHGGSNAAARQARGLDALTIRPLSVDLPPDEDWVVLRYIMQGEVHETKFQWKVLAPADAPNEIDPTSVAAKEAHGLGIDFATRSRQRAKKTLFAPGAIDLERRVFDQRGSLFSTGDVSSTDSMISVFPDIFSFNAVDSPQGAFGYIRIWNFQIDDPQAFLMEFIRILQALPPSGLIIDVRGNPGGSITAAELLLQALTPRLIEPERFEFISTPLTHRISLSDTSLQQWSTSIRQSMETGTAYSRGLPLNSGDAYNLMGQRYYGPIVLIIDALCYSAADVFIAGFQDHAIGPILGTADNTGAGGVNVWTFELLQSVLPADESPLETLPDQASFTVALRRSLRVHARSGTPVEDFGTIPDHLHRLTENDVLNGNGDLIARAVTLLVGLPLHMLAVKLNNSARYPVLTVSTTNLSRLDIYFNRRPIRTQDIEDGTVSIDLPVTALNGTVEIRGFSDDVLAAVRRLPIPAATNSEANMNVNSGSSDPITRRKVSPNEAFNLLQRLHQRGLVDLDAPMRTYLGLSSVSTAADTEHWYTIVGSLMTPPSSKG